MRVGTKPAPKAPRAPKQVAVNDWQFYPPKLAELQARETAAYQRSIGYKVPTREAKEGETQEEVEEERQREQEFIAAAEPLTEEEEKEKEELALQGFADWNRRDFQHFIKGAENNGRIAYSAIAMDIDTKTEKEVREYGEVFWRRYEELSDWQRLIERIDNGEEKRRKAAQSEELLRKRVNMPGFSIPYANANKSKTFDESEDLFILQRLSEYGLSEGKDVYDRIKKDIVTHDAFRWDWFIKSRTAEEIKRRSTTLLGLLNRDSAAGDDDSIATAPKTNGAGLPRGKKRKDLGGVNGDAGSANSSRASTPAVKGGAKKARKSGA